MRNYELTFIVEPNTDEEGVTGIVENVSQLVKSSDGAVTLVDVWGRKTLAYPINNHREGTYVRLEAKMDPATIVGLERNLKLSEQIIRYLLIANEDEDS